MKNVTVTIGLPTYESGESLISTLNSIYKQTALSKISKILLIVDGNKISNKILTKIRHPKLRILVKNKRKGQAQRLNDIFSMSNTDLLILTNDDVILNKNAVKSLISEFIYSGTDLISARPTPIKQRSLLVKILTDSTYLSALLAKKWNRGDNYLSCNGRLIALSHRFYKNLRIPANLWNNDAYLYLRVKMNNFTFKQLHNAQVYYKLPQTLNEHFNQSLKFSHSKSENQKFFSVSISEFYEIPMKIKISTMLNFLYQKPASILAYLFILMVARLQKFTKAKINNNLGFWPTDLSTKGLTGIYEK